MERMLTTQQIAAAIQCPLSIAERWADALNAAMALHDITTPKRQAAFLSQLAHESASLSRVAESFNYTPDALMATFNTPQTVRFTRDMANRYGRTKDHPADQKMIANIAYAQRMGNRGVESGDGWTYRGRGPIQLTGRKTIRLCGLAIGFDLEANPALLERPDVGSLAAVWFWAEGNRTGASLNKLADAGDIEGISKIVNGGRNGLDERLALSGRALHVLT